MAANATIIADVILKADVSGARSIANSLEELQKRAKDLEAAIAGATDPLQKRALGGELDKVNASMQALTKNTQQEIGLLNQLNAKVAQLNTAKGFAKTKEEIEAINKELHEANSQINKLNGAKPDGGGGIIGGVLLGSLGAEAINTAIQGIAQMGGSVIETRAQFEKFEAMLTTKLGSEQLAQTALGQATKMAADLPVELSEVVNAMIRFDNGTNFSKSKREIVAFTDLAASSGQSLQDLTDSYLSLVRGESDPIEKYGVSARVNGDKLMLTYNNVTKEVKRNAEDIRKYLVELASDPKIAGGAARLQLTLNGQIAALKDNVTLLLNDIGKGSSGVIAIVIGQLNTLIATVRKVPEYVEQNIEVIQMLATAVGGASAAIAAYLAVQNAKVVSDKLDVVLTQAKVFYTNAAAMASKVRTAYIEAETVAQGALNAVTMAGLNPLALLAAAVAAAGAAYLIYNSVMGETAVRTRNLAEVKANEQEIYAKEKANLEVLLSVAKDETQSKQARLEAIKKLNELSPEYLGNLTLDKINTDAAADAIDKYVLSLEKKARAEAVHEKQIGLQKQMLKVEEDMKAAIKLSNQSIDDFSQTQYDKVTQGASDRYAKAALQQVRQGKVDALKGDKALIKAQIDDLNEYSKELADIKPETAKKPVAAGASAEDKKKAEDQKKWLEAQYKSLRDLIQKEEDATQKLKDDAGRDSLSKIMLQNKREREVMVREMQERRDKFKEELKEKGIKESAAGAQKVFQEMSELQSAIGKKLDEQLAIATKKYKEGAIKLIAEGTAAATKESLDAEIDALKSIEEPLLAQREALIQKELDLRLFMLDEARMKEIKDSEARAQAQADIYGTTFEVEMGKLTNSINAKYSKRFDQATANASKAVSDAILANTKQQLDSIKTKQDAALQALQVGEAQAMTELNTAYSNGTVSHEKYEKTKTAITANFVRARLYGTKEGLLEEIKALEAALLDTGLNDKGKEKIKKQIADINAELAKTNEGLSLIPPADKATKKDYLDAASNLYGELEKLSNETIGRELKREEEKYNRLIAMQEKRIQRAQLAAEKGNAAALVFEQERMDKYIQKREEIVRKERELQAIQAAGAWLLAAATGAAAIAKAALDGGGWLSTITIAATVAGLLAGGAAVVSNFANMQGDASSSLGGFYDGGYTGDAGRREVAGVVHGQEYVMTAEATSRIGVNNLDTMNYSAYTPDLRREGAAVQNINIGLDPVVGELRRQTAMMRGDKRAALNDSRSARGNTGITRR